MSEQELAQPKVEPIKNERLSDGEIGNLISAFGNNEVKAITLLAIRDGGIYNRGDLHRSILSAQGDRVGWRLGTETPIDYCAHSLVPVGVVAREVLDPNLSTYGYQITDYGKRRGVPLCGLLSDWSRKHDISLNRLWGSTLSASQSTETIQVGEGEEVEVRKRAPITTLKILYELVTAPDLPIRQVDLAERLGETGKYIINHLERLSDAGLIRYQARDVNKPFSAYKLASLPKDELPLYKNLSLTDEVFRVLQSNPDSYLTINDVLVLLSQRFKDDLNKRSKLPITSISGVLSFLKRNGYVESRKFYLGMQSEIDLTDEQRVILSELLEFISRFQDQDPEILTRGRQLAEEIINNPSEVSNLLRRAKEASPFANRSSAPETRTLINYIISSHPGITNREIQHLLELEGRRLGRDSIMTLTRSLEKEDAIRTIQEGSVKKFFPLVPNS